jgi:hypothetical protein
MATLDELVVGPTDIAVHAMFRRCAGRSAVVSRRGLWGGWVGRRG